MDTDLALTTVKLNLQLFAEEKLKPLLLIKGKRYARKARLQKVVKSVQL